MTLWSLPSAWCKSIFLVNTTQHDIFTVTDEIHYKYSSIQYTIEKFDVHLDVVCRCEVWNEWSLLFQGVEISQWQNRYFYFFLLLNLLTSCSQIRPDLCLIPKGSRNCHSLPPMPGTFWRMKQIDSDGWRCGRPQEWLHTCRIWQSSAGRSLGFCHTPFSSETKWHTVEQWVLGSPL